MQVSTCKGRDFYVIRYATGDEKAVLDALVLMVQDQALNFDSFDAAILSHQLGIGLAKELKALNAGKWQ